MIRIAIVEDEKKHADILTGYLEQFGSAEGETFDVSLFKDAFSFWKNTARNTTSSSWIS